MESDSIMKSIKSVISFTLSLILMMLVFIFQISIFTSAKLYNPNSYTSNIEKSGLITYTYESTNTNLQSLGRTVNLPQNLFNNLFDKQWVKTQLFSSTNNMSQYMTYKTDTLYKIDVKSQSDKFNNNLDEFVKSNKLKIDKNTENELKKIKNDVNGIILNQVLPINFDSITKNSTFQNARKSLFLIYSSKFLFIIAIIIIIALLMLVNMKKVSSALAWTSYAFIAGGLLSLLPSAIGLASKFIYGLNLSVQSIKYFLIYVVNDFLRYFIFSGSITFIIGLILLFISLRIEKLNFSNKNREDRI